MRRIILSVAVSVLLRVSRGPQPNCRRRLRRFDDASIGHALDGRCSLFVKHTRRLIAWI